MSLSKKLFVFPDVKNIFLSLFARCPSPQSSNRLSWLSNLARQLDLCDHVIIWSKIHVVKHPAMHLWELDWLYLPLQRRRLASSSPSSPHKEHQALKPVFVVAKPCNYIVMWYSEPHNHCKMAPFTVRIWATRSNISWSQNKTDVRRLGWRKSWVRMLYGSPAGQPLPQLKSDSVGNTEHLMILLWRGYTHNDFMARKARQCPYHLKHRKKFSLSGMLRDTLTQHHQMVLGFFSLKYIMKCNSTWHIHSLFMTLVVLPKATKT